MPARRPIDPGCIAGWLVRSVAGHAEQGDDVLARLTGTTRAQIAAARVAATEPRMMRLVGGGSPPPAGAELDPTGATVPWSHGAAA
jgi:hypothetical protein